ncbi:hypothetical protein REPUB_Repub03eG0197400 [Reevesia pubescens]
MNNFPEETPLKDSYPQSGNRVEGYKEESSYQDHHQKQNQQQLQPLSAQNNQEQVQLKVPQQVSLSANWVSPQQHISNNKYPLPSSERSDNEEPHNYSAGSPLKNASYEEFIAADLEEQRRSSLINPKTGFPESWPEVPDPRVNVTSSEVEVQPSLAKILSQPAKIASPPNVPRMVQPPSSPPCFCCCSSPASSNVKPAFGCCSSCSIL